MHAVAGPRLMESMAMLPILHAKKGPLIVAAAGPMAEDLAREALRWREVSTVYLLAAPKHIKDKRIQVVAPIPHGKIDVMLISPEQRADPWLSALAPGGIINVASVQPSRWKELSQSLKDATGSATPWRNWLPTPIYGALAQNSQDKPRRMRQPPKGAKHLSPQYLPVLFTFSKDELPLALPKGNVRLANKPEGGS